MLYIYIVPGQGLTTPWERNFDANRNILSLRSFVTSLKKISLKSGFIHFFRILYMYITPGRGWQPLGNEILMPTGTSCHFGHLLQVSKKSLWCLVLYIFFQDFIHVYSPGSGADNPLETKFWCQQEHLVTSVICYKFKKKNLWSLVLYIFFIILYKYIALGQGQTAPRGQSFDGNRNVLSLHSFVASFKNLSSKILYNFFHDFIHLYSPKAETDSPQGTKFSCQQKGLITLLICCKFQRNLFEVWFYTIFSWFNTCIQPWGRGHTAPRGHSFDVNRNSLSLRSSVASFKSQMTIVSEKSIVFPFSHTKA